MTDVLHIRDISYVGQGGDADIAGYVKAGNPALIIRGHNGVTVDKAFVRNRQVAQDAGITELGIYQYLEQSRSAVTQAQEFLDAVGPLARNEFLVLDLEEGLRDQEARGAAWFGVVDPVVAPTRTLLYSGLSYAPGHGLNPLLRSHLGIIAAYRRSPEPSQEQAPHTFWQHSNGTTPPHPDPHLGHVDCTIFHGTIDELTALLHPEDNVALTDADVAKIINAKVKDPVTGQEVSLQTLLKWTRASAAHAVVDPSALAAAIVAKLPANPGGLTKDDVVSAVREVFADAGT